jgi:hypothetical protein
LFKSWKSRAAVFAVAATMAVPVLGIASPAGAAEDAAKASCKNDGWKTLVRADQTPFKNQGDCVSYAARGGQFVGPCLDSSTVYADFRLTGPIDTRGNGTSYSTGDGTCGGPVQAYNTIVSATSKAEADTKCLAVTPADSLAPFTNYGFAGPADWWVCAQIDNP